VMRLRGGRRGERRLDLAVRRRDAADGLVTWIGLHDARFAAVAVEDELEDVGLIPTLMPTPPKGLVTYALVEPDGAALLAPAGPAEGDQPLRLAGASYGASGPGLARRLARLSAPWDAPGRPGERRLWRAPHRPGRAR